jgi:hypothetical protein
MAEHASRPGTRPAAPAHRPVGDESGDGSQDCPIATFIEAWRLERTTATGIKVTKGASEDQSEALRGALLGT